MLVYMAIILQAPFKHKVPSIDKYLTPWLTRLFHLHYPSLAKRLVNQNPHH